MGGPAFGVDFGGRGVVITGAARGQGLAEAALFAELGAEVFLVDVAPGVVAAAAGLARRGGDVHAIQADVSSEADWARIVDAVTGERDSLDVLVNNAAVIATTGVRHTGAAEWERSLGVNLVGPALGCRAAAPLMIGAGRGCIVNVGSVAAFGGYFSAPYAVSKWGLRGLTRVAAAELGPHGVRAVAVHPGIVETPMSDGPGSPVAAFTSMTPAGRALSPEEVAGVVVFVASDHAAYLNGSDVVLDGGLLAAGPFAEIRRRIAAAASHGLDGPAG